MKDLRNAYLIAWDLAEKMNGDFKDCLLFHLSGQLGMPVVNKVRDGHTDEGVYEMTAGIKPDDSGAAETGKP